jgi:hypothetical protein
MMDVAQELEDLLEELVKVQKTVNKLTTKSVSGLPLRKRIKGIYKQWLPVLGVLENGTLVDASELDTVSEAWKRLSKLSDGVNQKSQFKPVIKSIIASTEHSLLHSFIKGSAIQTIGSALRRLVQPISDPELLKYLDESIRCAETNCVRASVVLAWCAVAFRVHEKLAALGMPRLQTELDNMRLDQGMMFKQFTRTYKVSTKPDIQEIPDAHLILLCRFLTYLDDTQYKHLRGALDLRNGCGHPTGYQPDPVKLQAYYADITQLVLLNPKFV